MFSLTEDTPLYMCLEPVDMRKGIDGLYRMVLAYRQHPLSGSAFVFFGKNWQCVKILRWGACPFPRSHPPGRARRGLRRSRRDLFQDPRAGEEL